jgi:hypothetical protein
MPSPNTPPLCGGEIYSRKQATEARAESCQAGQYHLADGGQPIAGNEADTSIIARCPFFYCVFCLQCILSLLQSQKRQTHPTIKAKQTSYWNLLNSA